MKLVTYSHPSKPSKTTSGMLWGEWILPIPDLPKLAGRLQIPISQKIRKLSNDEPTIIDVISRGVKLLDDLQKLSWRFFNRIKPEKVPSTLKRAGEVTLQAPIPKPPTLRDFYVFEEHVKNARARRGLEIPPEWYEFPAFYYSNPNVIYGPEQDVPYPSYTKKLDYELEIASVIGTGGMNISEQDAETCIAGYMIMNDWSARDIQVGEMKIGLGPAKAKDFATSLGPWLVTTDELQDRQVAPGKFNLEMTAKVNGKELSHGNVKSMHWTFSQMIARASQSVQLQPGEVFGSGTVGSGSLLELGESVHGWLKPGDEVELEIERLGVLRNRIKESAKS
jgi:2-keto-4-pentenoate hydratase/2-oxohepta-3-ene-1,7-dioic acid hydratase in catechol pathway